MGTRKGQCYAWAAHNGDLRNVPEGLKRKEKRRPRRNNWTNYNEEDDQT